MLTQEVGGAVARLIIDRPEARNALDLDTMIALEGALERLAVAPDLRVVVLTGAGDRAFCAGADLAALAAWPEARSDAAHRFASLVLRLYSFPRPVVLRLNGHCVAGGMALLLATDFAVAHSGVTLSLPEGNVGMWPMVVGAMLRRAVGERVANDLALTARRLDAEEARRLGLVQRVVAPEALDDEVESVVQGLLRMSPTALRLGRHAWRSAADLPLETAIPRLADALAELLATEDATEGFLAFVERRPPRWKDC